MSRPGGEAADRAREANLEPNGERSPPCLPRSTGGEPAHEIARIMKGEVVMLRQLIDKEAVTLRRAVHAVREWIHPSQVMKRHAFDRPLDDLGQSPEDVDRQVPPETKPTSKPMD